MPYDFNSQIEYDINIQDILKFYNVPNKYTQQIIQNYNLVAKHDHENIFKLWTIQGNVKQVFDIYIPLNDFSPSTNDFVSFTFNVDRILKYINLNQFNTKKVNPNSLHSNIKINSHIRHFDNTPIIIASMYNPTTINQSILFTVDGNHRVTYCKQNNLQEVDSIYIDYLFLQKFNPFDSYSEYFLYVLFLEIQIYYTSTKIEKFIYRTHFFKTCTEINIINFISSIPL